MLNKDISKIIDKISLQSHILSVCFNKTSKSKYKDELYWALYEAEDRINHAFEIAKLESKKIN